jgi:hypothetical protein
VARHALASRLTPSCLYCQQGWQPFDPRRIGLFHPSCHSARTPRPPIQVHPLPSPQGPVSSRAQRGIGEVCPAIGCEKACATFVN